MSAALTCFESTCDSEASQDGGPLKCCARCDVALYCSSQCQQADWTNHKEICRFSASFISRTLPDLFTSPLSEDKAKLKKAAGDWFNANKRLLRRMAWENHPFQSLNDKFLWINLKKLTPFEFSAFQISSSCTLPISALDGLPTVEVGGQDILKGEIRRALRIREELRLTGHELRLVVVASSDDSILIPGAEIFSGTEGSSQMA